MNGISNVPYVTQNTNMNTNQFFESPQILLNIPTLIGANLNSQQFNLNNLNENMYDQNEDEDNNFMENENMNNNLNEEKK